MAQNTYLGAHWRGRRQWDGLLYSGFSYVNASPSASRRRSAYSRSRRPMNFAKAIPPKMNMHSATKIPMLFVDVGRFSGTCISTSCAALNSVL